MSATGLTSVATRSVVQLREIRRHKIPRPEKCAGIALNPPSRTTATHQKYISGYRRLYIDSTLRF